MKEWERYFETDAEDGTEVQVSVDYSLGGWNWFNGDKERRGYYVYVTPVVREKWEYGTSVRFTLGTGFKVLLKEVTRRSKKATAEAVALGEEKAQELAERLAADQGFALVQVVKEGVR